MNDLCMFKRSADGLTYVLVWKETGVPVVESSDFPPVLLSESFGINSYITVAPKAGMHQDNYKVWLFSKLVDMVEVPNE